MLYGDEKLREMARSILPSCRRKTARAQKRQINRSRRRKVNMEMHRITVDPEVWEDSPDIRGETEKSAMCWTVSDRRAADKLEHFEKCTSLTPEYLMARYHIGVIYERMGDSEAAAGRIDRL